MLLGFFPLLPRFGAVIFHLYEASQLFVMLCQFFIRNAVRGTYDEILGLTGVHIRTTTTLGQLETRLSGVEGYKRVDGARLTESLPSGGAFDR